MDLEVLGIVVEDQATFSQSIARRTKRWFTDIDESLERLVNQGMVEADESQCGLSGFIFLATDKGVEFLERTSTRAAQD